jgi:hypothetical protein
MKRIGKRPRRYHFLLNPYPDERLSKCPRCHKPTHPRKFALFVHIDSWGPLTLGKTCRYCTPCELIIVHPHEMEAELAHSFSQLKPEVIGNDYFVVGTVDKAVWKQGLQGEPLSLDGILKHLADFKGVLTLDVEPGRWRPKDQSQAGPV